MAYLVEFAARAVRDLEILYAEKNAAESPAAAGWFNGLENSVSSLAAYPNRCPRAPEGKKLKRGLRNLLYGTRPHVYRVIYEVYESCKTVWVLHIHHGARMKLRPSDLK
jgi:mRNA-degrading endonuclease RelE of RelBE toxin-antitoxin system